MIAAKCADGRVEDAAFPHAGRADAIGPILAQRVERFEIEFMPETRFKILVRIVAERREAIGGDPGINLCLPRAYEAGAEGFAEFFTSPSANCTST
jgi:hypothetical protein